MPETYMTDMLGKASAFQYQILIAHNPEYFEKYAEWGADLTVSGHMHGGLMRLPFFRGCATESCVFRHGVVIVELSAADAFSAL
jgi:hypothetical protein